MPLKIRTDGAAQYKTKEVDAVEVQRQVQK